MVCHVGIFENLNDGGDIPLRTSWLLLTRFDQNFSAPTASSQRICRHSCVAESRTSTRILVDLLRLLRNQQTYLLCPRSDVSRQPCSAQSTGSMHNQSLAITTARHAASNYSRLDVESETRHYSILAERDNLRVFVLIDLTPGRHIISPKRPALGSLKTETETPAPETSCVGSVHPERVLWPAISPSSSERMRDLVNRR